MKTSLNVRTLQDWSARLEAAAESIRDLEGGASASAWNAMKYVSGECDSICRAALSAGADLTDPPESAQDAGDDSTLGLAGYQADQDRIGRSGKHQNFVHYDASAQGPAAASEALFRARARAAKKAASAFRMGRRRKRRRRKTR